MRSRMPDPSPDGTRSLRARPARFAMKGGLGVRELHFSRRMELGWRYHVLPPGAREYFFRDAPGHQLPGVMGAHFRFGNCRALPPLLVHGVHDEFHAHRGLSLNGEREPVDGLVGGLPENLQLVFSTGHTSSIARR